MNTLNYNNLKKFLNKNRNKGNFLRILIKTNNMINICRIKNLDGHNLNLQANQFLLLNNNSINLREVSKNLLDLATKSKLLQF